MASLSEFFSDPASSGVWTVDAGRSAVTAKSKSFWGVLPVKVRFTEFTGATADVEHLRVDQAGPFHVDDRGLRLADHPRRGVGLVGIVKSGEGWGGIHEIQGSTSTWL